MRKQGDDDEQRKMDDRHPFDELQYDKSTPYMLEFGKLVKQAKIRSNFYLKFTLQEIFLGDKMSE
jgi:hypothetical protein